MCLYQKQSISQSQITSQFFGIIKENVAPFPWGLLCASILPPCDSIIFLDTNNPNPVPPESVETNFENSFGCTAGDSPVPVSFILTRILSLLSLYLISVVSIVISPRVVNLIALCNRFEITLPNLTLSATKEM